jgi:hypothetical protein
MPTNPLEDMHQSFIKSQDESGNGTLAGLANMLKGAGTKADAGTTRIPLSILPPGTKAGDRVSLTVTGVDPVAGTVTLVPDSPTEAVPEAPAAKEPIDTGTTMGPMNDLRSYLVKKTMEQE